MFHQNYDFPNNCEDYIHRIGRTGVSLHNTNKEVPNQYLDSALA